MMKLIKSTLALAAFLFTFSAIQAQQAIDSQKSTLDFMVKNFGVEVEGKLSGLTGSVTFDAANLSISNFEVKIPVNTVDTDTEKRDEHLLEEDFFHADAHPNIEFVSNSVKADGAGFVATGYLKMKGIEQEEKITFKVEGGALVGRLEIDRQHYKVGGSGMLDTIGDEVVIDIRCVLK